jgi:hypothetical protein
MSTETENKPEVAVRCTGWVGDEPQARSIDLGKSQITPIIRVSSAALMRDDWWGSWWLVETWIFSDDPRQKSRQIIHGDSGAGGGRPPHERICATARKVHGQIAENLRRRFANVETGAESPTKHICD